MVSFVSADVQNEKTLLQMEISFSICMICVCLRRGKGFPGGAVVESLPANAGDTGSSPGLGGSHMPRSN